MIEATQLLKYSLQDELKRITNIIVDKCNPDKIILFGSMAKGTAKEWSDIDLVVIMDTDMRFTDRILFLMKLTHPRVGVDFLVYTPEEEESFKKNADVFYNEEVLKKGVILHDRNSQI